MAKRVRGFGFDQALRLMRQGEVVGRLSKETLYRIARSLGVGRSAFATVGQDRMVAAYGFGSVPFDWQIYIEIGSGDLLATDWVREADWRKYALKHQGDQAVAKQAGLVSIALDDSKPAVQSLLYSEKPKTGVGTVAGKGQTSLATKPGGQLVNKSAGRTKRKAK